MTPQEFFKNDLFAEKAGIVLMEVREGYSKARLEIKKEHLNAGNRLCTVISFIVSFYCFLYSCFHVFDFLSFIFILSSLHIHQSFTASSAGGLDIILFTGSMLSIMFIAKIMIISSRTAHHGYIIFI